MTSSPRLWSISSAELLQDHTHRYGIASQETVRPGAERLGRTWLDSTGPIWHGLDHYDPPIVRDRGLGLSQARPPDVGEFDSSTIPSGSVLLRNSNLDPKIVADAERLKSLATGPLKAYSIREIRELANEPRWTENYVNDVLMPLIGNLNRAVDRKGKEPHLFFAARLAHFMNGCPDGTTEADMLQAFFQREAVPLFWPTFTPVDLCRLRVIYPFIPRWSDQGVKTQDAFADHTRFWPADLAVLASVPLYDPTLESIAQTRREHGRMKDVALIEAAGTFANVVPRLNALVEIDGMWGKNIHMVAKHYSSSKLLVEAIQAEFGAEVELTIDDALEKSQQMVRDVVQQIESGASGQGAPKKILTHVEGVKHFWPWYCSYAAEHDVPLLGLSHTTSDGRDLMKNVADPDNAYLELMSLSAAKVADERLRFERSFKALIDHVGKSLPNTEIYDRPWVVMGYGTIIGPAMANALKALEIPYVVLDPDPARQAAAVEEGHTIGKGLDDYLSRDPFLVECAGTQVLGREQMEKFTGNPVLISLGSGRYGFDMEGLEQMAESSGVPVPKHKTGTFGWLPIVDYDTDNATFTAIADGYVANLAFPEPHHSAYAMTTQMLVWEGMRQVLYNHEKQRPGAHILRSFQIETEDKEGGGVIRNLHLYPRDIEAENGDELAEKIQKSRSLNKVTSGAHAFRIFHHIYSPPQQNPSVAIFKAARTAFDGGWDSAEEQAAFDIDAVRRK